MDIINRGPKIIQRLPEVQQPCYLITRRRNTHLMKSNSAIEQINLDNLMQDSAKSEVKLQFTQSKRQKQHLNYIKEKFIKMIQLQNKNFLEKNQLQKQRQRQIKDDQSRTKMKVKKIKDRINHSLVTSRNWRIKNMHDGALMRQIKLQNQHLIAKRDSQDLKTKKTFVIQKLKDNFYYKGKLSQSKTQRFQKKELKYDQEYRCGLIYEMSQTKYHNKNTERSQQEYSSASYRQSYHRENEVKN